VEGAAIEAGTHVKSSLLEGLLRGRGLDDDEARAVMHEILAGQWDEAELAAFLVALRAKRESAVEIAGFAQAMREHATAIPCRRRPLVDTCGTGGDGAGTFNISTASAFVVAAAGAAVAKHGNRAVSSRCGSADLLEALGARVDLPPEAVGRCVDEVGIGFLFAPALHGAMRHAAGVRRSLGIRTVFNLLGPLTNPAGAQFQLLGVFSDELLDPMAEVLGLLGSSGALVVRGRDGLDELSVCAISDARHLRADGSWQRLEIDPAEFDCGPHPRGALTGGGAADNARVLREIFAGAEGAFSDVVRLNAGAALWICGRCPSLQEGVALAGRTVASGAAAETLDHFVAWTRDAAS
jgi:anthranilate phosphoribosyltransferase